MKSPIILFQALLTDVSRLEPNVKGLDRDFLTVETRFEHEGYGFLTIALPALSEALTLGLSTGRFSCPIGFKTTKGGAIPRFLSGMLSEVFDPSSGFLKDNPNLGAVKCLREILNVFKKVKLTNESEELLDKKAKLDFFENDELISSHVTRPDFVHHLEHVSKVILPYLSTWDEETFFAKHGPGAVSEGLKGNQKWASLVEAIEYDGFDTLKYGYTFPGMSLDNAVNCDSMSNSWLGVVDVGITDANRLSRCTAKLITVPKNSSSRRTITIEPFLNQFLQGGLNVRLRQEIDRCPILSQCLALTDQSQNQKLAMEGSQTGKWATLDLKSASDLLSVSLVRSVFRHHMSFLDMMLECRSTHVSSDGVARQVSKFAGMGNALTFPTQSICFAVVALSAILHAQGKKPGYKNVKAAARHIRVYGDDIIVDTAYASSVVIWLEAFGLKVNSRKSFLGGNFKESCGVDAFNGVDVTPLYLRFRPDELSVDPNVIAGLVSTSNQAWLRGLYSFSTCLVDEVESRLRKRLPLVSQDSGSLGWFSRQDSMTPHRWNKVLHRLETRVMKLNTLKRSDSLDGWAALLKFFHVPLLGRARDHLKKTSIRYKVRFKTTWVPTYVGP